MRLVTGDTGEFYWGAGTFASRGAVVAGNAIHAAAVAVRKKILKKASDELEVAEEDLELVDGTVRVKGSPQTAIPLGELALKANPLRGAVKPGAEPGLEATDYFGPERGATASGVHAMIVEVDPETMMIEIKRYVVVHDCGRVINPMILEGQIQGGVAQGIGNAFYEQLVFDENGQLLNASFMDYLLPTADTVPHIESDHVETPSPLNPLGIKGAGEAGAIPVGPLFAQAIEDAFHDVRLEILEIPLSPSRLFELVSAAQRNTETSTTVETHVIAAQQACRTRTSVANPASVSEVVPVTKRGGMPRWLVRLLLYLGFIVAFVVIWEGSKALFNIPDYKLPHLSQIAEAFLRPTPKGPTWQVLLVDALYTGLEALIGFIVGSVTGFLFAVLFIRLPLTRRGLLPFVIASQTVPIIAIAPMIVVGLGALGAPPWLPKAIIAAYLTFFPVTINVLRGLESVHRDALSADALLRRDRRQIFRKLRLPNSMPYLFTALKISSTASVIGAIIGELPVGSTHGIGVQIVVGSQYNTFNPGFLWATIIVAALLGMVFYGAVALAEKRIVKWR